MNEITVLNSKLHSASQIKIICLAKSISVTSGSGQLFEKRRLRFEVYIIINNVTSPVDFIVYNE